MKNSFILFTISLLFWGCNRNQTVFDATASAPVTIDAAISRGGASVNQSDTSMKSVFSNHDDMGVFIDKQKSHWTLSDGIWQSDGSYYWMSAEVPVHFCAYYPYTSQATFDAVPMPDLSVQDGLQPTIVANDFITAHHSASYQTNQGKVSFAGNSSFEHHYALLSIRLRNKFTEPSLRISLQNIFLEGKDLFTHSSFSFNDSSIRYISPSIDKLSFYMDESYQSAVHDGILVLKFLVNPIQLDSSPVFTIYFHSSGSSSTPLRASTSLPVSQFKSGYYYLYDLTINPNGEITIDGTQINGREEERLPDIHLPE